MVALTIMLSFFFFFQAEDGIRDYKVTGVQTCALPISRSARRRAPRRGHRREGWARRGARLDGAVRPDRPPARRAGAQSGGAHGDLHRRRARRHAHGPRRRRRPRDRRTRLGGDRLRWRGLARRPAERARGGTRRRDRRPRAVRGPLHPARSIAMHRRLTPGLALLRATGLAALLILIWNPIAMRRLPRAAPPLVLLDASLSMTGHGGRWREALDSARALAAGGGVIWRFGDAVAAFDSTPPAYGASRLEPALAAAAARGGAGAVGPARAL